MNDQPEFDVFLAHNSIDKPFVKYIAQRLRRSRLKPWLDEEAILPGQIIQEEIQKVILQIKSAAIFIGKHGLGRWQKVELRSLYTQCVEKGIPVIPVLLPDADEFPSELVFLKEHKWVMFTTGIEDKKALEELKSAIRQQRQKNTSNQQNFHYKNNIEDVKHYFRPDKIQSKSFDLLQITKLLQESYIFDVVNVDLGHIFSILGDNLAAGIPLLLVEQQFFTALEFRFSSGSHFDAEKLYQQCFVNLWNFPEMTQLIGRLITIGLVYRPSGPGEYTLTNEGASLLEHLRSQNLKSQEELKANLTCSIAKMIPILTVNNTLKPDSFIPKIKVEFQVDFSDTVKQIELMCRKMGLTYYGYFADTGFIARRKRDNKFIFIDLVAELVSQPFDKVIDEFVLNDDAGTYFLRVTINGEKAAIRYASAEITVFSSDLSGIERKVQGFCLTSRSERPLTIKNAPFS
jgi:hypothetical protein